MRLVASNTGGGIEEARVTVMEAGPTGQAGRVAITNLTSSLDVGQSDVFFVRASELDIDEEYDLRTYSFRGSEIRGVAFNRGCTRATEAEVIRNRINRTFTYLAYGCRAPGSSVWAELEELGGVTVHTAGPRFVRVVAPPPTYTLTPTPRPTDTPTPRPTPTPTPTPTPPDPPRPANLEVTSTSRTSISLDWDSRTGISKYRVRYGSNRPETTSSSYTVTGLSCGTSYTFRVSAYGNGSTYKAVWGDDSTVSDSTDPCPRPPGQVRDLALTTGDMSLRATWNPPTSSGSSAIRRYELEYKRTTVAAWTPLAPGHGVSATATVRTISGLTNGSSYDVQVRACNFHRCGAWSQATGTPRDPVITIARQHNAVTEGDQVRFTLTANPAPVAAALTVNVRITEGGSFLTGDVPSQITIASGDMTAELILRTANDTVDEANGTVEATVLPGTGYRVGSTSSDSVTVEDDDLPAAPTGLHANGHLVDGKITLRWNPVPGATGYEVRYAEEVCVRASRPGRPDDAVCGLGDPPMWSTITADGITTEEITIDGAAVLQTTLKLTPPDPLRSKRCYNRLGFDLSDVTPSCIPWPLYRVEVQAIIVDASDWSDFALIFPTSEPNRSSDANVFYDYRVATNEFRPKYQPERNGSHEYGYTLCRGTITTDVAP